MLRKPRLVPLLLIVSLGAFSLACGGDSKNKGTTSSGGTGGSSNATGGTGGSGGSGGSNSGTSSGASGGSGGSNSGTSSGGGGGSGGSGGSGGGGGSGGNGGSGGSGGAGTTGTGGAAGAAGEGGASVCDTIDEGATITSHLRITTDNECEVFVNGSSVGTTTDWTSPVTIDVSLFLHPSKLNVVAIAGTNTSSQAGNDRGILGELTIDDGSGTQELVVTDASWKVSDQEETGWMDVDFDDSGWAQATEVANHGDAPWGALLGTSDAKWIWSAPIPVAVSDKPNEETTYARKSFYFSVDGATPSETSPCPE